MTRSTTKSQAFIDKRKRQWEFDYSLLREFLSTPKSRHEILAHITIRDLDPKLRAWVKEGKLAVTKQSQQYLYIVQDGLVFKNTRVIKPFDDDDLSAKHIKSMALYSSEYKTGRVHVSGSTLDRF